MHKSLSTLVFVYLLSLGQLVASHLGSTELPPATVLRSPGAPSPAALPNLPITQAVAALDDPLDTDNIQADILAGMHKNKEFFFFFSVNDATTFKAKLSLSILPLITSTSEILSVNTQPITAVNIAFSHTGLVALGVNDDLGDPDFVAGQFSQTTFIGDNHSLWNPAFAGTNIHGVLLLASDTVDNINTELANIQSILSTSITEIFLVFRQLQQLVPEFNKFLTDNSLDVDELSPEQGSELLDARMVGRWKSDDPVLAADPNRNNDFSYLIASNPEPSTENHFNQINCPFGAHIRKVHPRRDLDPSVENSHFIIRSSIPYDPEATTTEATTSTTSVDRGLAFVSYQSNVFNGFGFLQSVWINSINFPFGKVGLKFVNIPGR
ncbi:Dye-decolorizing peroxidase [Mycena venus]|uniref:Dye-decolorizing peroxidase n=1 Tax=Mycena venus TaxID=2733690 RepID=A0A8H7DB34_9AGAR|nr:Dye-decolorizing peroxidase [Mycena venus]